MCGERDECGQINWRFPFLIFGWEMVTSILKTNNSNNVGDVKPSVLWHSMKNQVSFIRHLKEFLFYVRLI